MAKAQVSQIPVQTLEQALLALCGGAKTQSGQHIRPFHAHCSNRLVVEGGFPPEWVRPIPPLVSKQGANNKYGLSYSKAAENSSEQSVLGGMKYKNIDVTVVIPGIGPAVGISAKSTGNAFRNLTNRMEEAPGDCVNIHMMYPGFVFGFLHLIRFARVTDVTTPNDASFDAQGNPLDSIVRYHNALSALTGEQRSLILQCDMNPSVSLYIAAWPVKQKYGRTILLLKARFIIHIFFRSSTTPMISATPIRIPADAIIESCGQFRKER
jgi:hypothetical protein